MLANVDRLVVGEDAGLEIKTTSEYNKDIYQKGNIPPQYYAQCMHYMAVTGLSKWYIAIYIPGVDLYCYEVLRSDDEVNALIEQEKEFWNCVENDIEPPIDGSDSTAQAISELHPVENDEDSIVNIHDNNKSTRNDCEEAIKRCGQKGTTDHQRVHLSDVRRNCEGIA